MYVESVTTPHGRRSVDLAQLRRQANNARDLSRSALTANKWQVFRDVCAARHQLGLKDRALAVLNALLSFYPDTELSKQGLVVFPSNNQLSARANGIAGATLRRALAALVEAGLIERQDSPNGKRYARRDGAGEITRAYGFALTPLLIRAAEISSLAAHAAEEARELRKAREELSIARRDVRKMIAAASELENDPKWLEMADAYEAILAGLPRNPDHAETLSALAAMGNLRALVLKALNLNDKPLEMSVNDAPNERHIEDLVTDNHIEQKNYCVKLNEELTPPEQAIQAARSPHLPLDMVLKACPQIIEYASSQTIRSWRELQHASSLASSMLGITKMAWIEACDVMGIENASTSVAHILERHEQIKSPGGYLRNLTERTRTGQYNPTQVIMSLLVTRSRKHGRSYSRGLMN